MNYNKILFLFNDLANIADQIFLENFREQPSIEIKKDLTPVTIADKKIEETLIKKILSNYPKHTIISEELNSKTIFKKNQNLWAIDPIDGTLSFVTGNPLCGTLIYFQSEMNQKFGMINIPFTQERWTNSIDGKTLYNNIIINKNNKINKNDLSIACTTPYMFTEEQLEKIHKVKNNATIFRFGGDCYNYGLLCSGHLQAIIEADLKYYDILAIIPLIQGVGGSISDWKGNDIEQNWDGTILATENQFIHDKLLKILN